MAPILQRNFTDTAPPTNLTTNIDNLTTTTSIPVNSTAGYPPAPFTGVLERNTINQEFVLVTVVPDVNHFTVVRAYDGTVPVSHLSPATFEHAVGGIDYREANLHHSDTTRDDHLQYMNANGARHDLANRHYVGTTIAAGSPGTSNPGDTGAVGSSQAVAAADHQHVRESTATLQNLVLPVGSIIMWAGPQTATPAGFMFCLGQQISRSAYPVLFSLFSTSYGPGDGSTTFNLPNFSGRSPIGTGRAVGMGNLYTIGSIAGEETHTLGLNEMPTHYHSINDPGHYHSGLKQAAQYTGNAAGDGEVICQYVGHTGPLDGGAGTWSGVSATVPPGGQVPWGEGAAPPYTMITGVAATGISNNNAGGGGAHNNIHPVIGVNFLVRVG